MKKVVWKKNIILLILVSCLSFLNTSCIYMVVGGVGALGGYIISPDTVEGISDKDPSLLYEKALGVLSVMGLIEEQYEETGIIHARVSNARITVTITPISETTAKISVKARKYHFPRINLAQDIFVKIMIAMDE